MSSVMCWKQDQGDTSNIIPPSQDIPLPPPSINNHEVLISPDRARGERLPQDIGKASPEGRQTVEPHVGKGGGGVESSRQSCIYRRENGSFIGRRSDGGRQESDGCISAAGGRSGLHLPEGLGGRRGSVGKAAALEGEGAKLAISWQAVDARREGRGRGVGDGEKEAADEGQLGLIEQLTTRQRGTKSGQMHEVTEMSPHRTSELGEGEGDPSMTSLRSRLLSEPDKSVWSSRDDIIAGVIRRNILEGHSDFLLLGPEGDKKDCLACAKKIWKAFRRRQKDLDGVLSPADANSISVNASELAGVLGELGMQLSPTEMAYLIERCATRIRPGSRPSPGGRDEATIRAGDLLSFFRELLTRSNMW
ncbi:unnamed protein product [Choristocarpus tenellus]